MFIATECMRERDEALTVAQGNDKTSYFVDKCHF